MLMKKKEYLKVHLIKTKHLNYLLKVEEYY